MPADTVRILFVGDVFGHAGRDVIVHHMDELRRRGKYDLVVVNGENAAGGNGITPNIADAFFKHGVDVITTGDHVWDRKELEEYLYSCERITRPLNFPDESPGRGVLTVETADYRKVRIINLVGRVFMRPADNPFIAVERALKKQDQEYPITIVDFHAEATSEMIAMGRFLDGKVSAVLGTHTHIPTADETILPGGTAYITDVGMTGPCDSIIGLQAREVINNYRIHLRRRFHPADKDLRLQGAVVEVDIATGKAVSIERIEERFDD